MSIKVVIGLGFGDEGKGITTDYLCSQAKKPRVIRFSGGQQAGHTVVYNGMRHTFSNFGSGTLRGTPTYWSKYCTMDPVGIMNEHSALDAVMEGRNIPHLYIDPLCPVTTPFDKQFNKKDGESLLNGTCGVGVGATWQREEDHYHLHFKDLFFESVLAAKLAAVGDYYLRKHVKVADHIVESFFEACQFVVSNIVFGDVKKICSHDIIFEGSQGLLLDQDIGFFPNVTRSNTGMKNVLEILKEAYSINMYPEVYLVTRAYQTRHGNGPMTYQGLMNINPGPAENNKDGGSQGKFRKTILDLDLLEYAIISDTYLQENGKNLVITCLDHIESNWTFMSRGKRKEFATEDAFVEEIQRRLNVNKVIRVRSPQTEDFCED